MKSFQKDFIDLAIRCEALSFGEFTLKSGRVSPYFFNAGKFRSGKSLSQLGACYAHALVDENIPCDMLFGPAYKGILLAAATSISLANLTETDVDFVYNRKEAKTHGEGGVLVGASLTTNTVIIDDVITAGTAIREVLDIFKQQDRAPTAIIVGLDRQEKGPSGYSAIAELEQETGVKVISIVSLNDIISWLKDSSSGEHLDAVEAYRKEYGV